MPRGRPRKIATSDALHAVMVAFWERGYSGTSMNDLALASGVAKPGLYASFGDKDQIFEKALVYYFDTLAGPIFKKLRVAEKHVIDDFRDFLGAVTDVALDPSVPSGCFLVNSLVEHAYSSERQQELVIGLRDSRHVAIRERLLKAVAAGEMPEDTDIDRTAIFIEGQFNAVALLGRSGRSADEMEQFIEAGLRALPVENRERTYGKLEFAETILRL